ncbi:hypothetical protein [Ammoniphilus resinae]|uniref:Uncharacterized protein n=1 Tax=Ammoniphilus resinae TaxID=861532 RepID=A0ABS4GNE8_9BACL|nr:hypothetical protein [Ammoniphilus resinae]MBP1931789.1 hypothetical protein [Ammoniphilus resinae]
MDPFQEKMICQVCPDKRKTVLATDITGILEWLTVRSPFLF